MKKSELIQIIKEEVKKVLKQPLKEGWGMDEIKAIHFETDPAKQEQLKKAYGRKTGAMSSKTQIEAADYALAKFRKQIKYEDGKDLGPFVPHSSMAAFSTLGSGPHAKKISWNQREYDKWIKSMAGDGGTDNAYDMAQNAKFEPGLIDWVKRNVVYDETPLERIQWDIESYT